MKLRNSVILTLLLSLGLTGCYTQLEYSQRMQRVSEAEPVEGYSWDGNNERVSDSIYIAETEEGKAYISQADQEYTAYANEEEQYQYDDEGEVVPVYYKNYEIANWWDDCGCNPYSYSYGYGNYPFETSYYGYHPGVYSSYYANNWRLRRFNRYYGVGFGFHIYDGAFGLGFYSGDPFFYDPYLSWPYWFTYNDPYYGYWGGGYYGYPGYHYYHGGGWYNGSAKDSEVASRRRNIGTNRVTADTRSRVRERSSATGISRTSVSSGNTSTTRSRGTVQQSHSRSSSTRSAVTRSRGTSRVQSQPSSSHSQPVQRSRGSVTRAKGQSSNTSSRSRSRGENKQMNSSVGINSSNGIQPRVREHLENSRPDRSKVQNNITRQRVRQSNANSATPKHKSSFFGRIKNVINSASSSVRNRVNSNNSGSIHVRRSGSTSRPSIHRSGNSTHSTTVKQRSSSSSSSRSRGSSSRSRSSSGSHSSGRSRGHR